MTIPKGGVLLALAIAALACGGPRYYADVPGRTFDVSGEYAIDEVAGRNGCGTFTPVSRKGSVTVEHSPNATDIAVIRGDESFVGVIRSDGKFKTEPGVAGSGRSATLSWLEGRFNVSGLEATLHVQTGDIAVPIVPTDRDRRNWPSACEYTMRWSGKRL